MSEEAKGRDGFEAEGVPAEELRELTRSGASAATLLPHVYDALRRLAARRLAEEKEGTLLDPTALVHEAWLRVAGGEGEVAFDGKGHFFGAAAQAMRRILVERARRRGRLKHGGGHGREPLGEPVAPRAEDTRLLALDEALEALEATDAEKARLVELRFFAGLSVAEAARLLGQSPSTAERSWRFVRAWLRDRLEAR